MKEQSGSLRDDSDNIRLGLIEKAKARIGYISELVAHIGGEAATIDEVFPLPPEVRADAAAPEWDSETEQKVRNVAHEFGYGAEQNVGSGLEGGARIVEGGLAWKIAAEATMLASERAENIVFAGSAHRKLREDEITFVKLYYGIDLSADATEYDVAKLAATRQINGLVQEQTLPFGYEVAEGNPIIQEATGQLINLGSSSEGTGINVLRIDRDNYEVDGQPKYRYQPSSEVIMRLISDISTAVGDQTSPVALITSNTYASRVPDAWRAGAGRNRQFGVAMYGRATLAEVKGEPMSADSPLNQLPGDLRIMHDNLQKLLNELQ